MLPSLLEEILKEIEIFEITEAEFEIGKKAQIEDYLNTLIKPKARFQKEFLFLIGEPIEKSILKTRNKGLAVDICSQLVLNRYQPLRDCQRELEKLTFSEFQDTCR